MEESCQQIARWQAVTLKAAPTKTFFENLQSPAPNIETADITLEPPHPKLLDLFRGEPTRLHSLRLSGLSIPWRTGMLSGLRCLEIRKATQGPQLSDLIAALGASPRLESLKLAELGDVGGSEAAVVLLPALQTLHLAGLSATSASAILSHITAPCSYSFLLNCVVHGPLPPSLFHSIAPFFQAVSPPLEPISLLLGSEDPQVLEFRVDEKQGHRFWRNPRFHVVVEGASPTIMLNAMIDSLGPPWGR